MESGKEMINKNSLLLLVKSEFSRISSIGVNSNGVRIAVCRSVVASSGVFDFKCIHIGRGHCKVDLFFFSFFSRKL